MSETVTMTREEKIRRLQVGLIRSGNAFVIRTERPGAGDDELLRVYGESARPLAEALLDVIEAANDEPPAASSS